MRILAIETSCDETAIAILECTGDEKSASFKVVGNALLSQIEAHREFGGVFPALAKREHAKNLVPVLSAALEEAELLVEDRQVIPEGLSGELSKLLEREPTLGEQLIGFLSETETPAIDAIAVTAGPGLEPALWVGINFAKALALAWEKPVVAVNHMEGHILAALARKYQVEGSRYEGLEIKEVEMPVLALLISGAHTELVLMKSWPASPETSSRGGLEYELLGQTRDDAVGEAFDKVARLLGLPYPGGPEISRLAEEERRNRVSLPMNDFVSPSSNERLTKSFKLPRPMFDSNTCDFSFAGLKTAVLYLVKDIPDLTEEKKKHIALEFENAVADVLWKKTGLALEQSGARTLVIGGGVSANTHIRRIFMEKIANQPGVTLRIPAADLTTDNAIMIGLAGFYRALRSEFSSDITANGNLTLG